jgi:hypothetical protein
MGMLQIAKQIAMRSLVALAGLLMSAMLAALSATLIGKDYAWESYADKVVTFMGVGTGVLLGMTAVMVLWGAVLAAMSPWSE